MKLSDRIIVENSRLGGKSITDSSVFKSLVTFRVCLALSVLVVLVQITLGGFVRVTGSGLGCPDWPLCDGRIVPVFERSAIIEFSHRIVASVVLLSSSVSSFLAWRFYRNDLLIIVPSLMATMLVLAAAILGAVVVWTELVWWVRIIHLIIAQSIAALLMFALVASFKSKLLNSMQSLSIPKNNFGLMLSLTGIMVVILSGSHMVGYGASSSCATWPLCRGELFPEGTAYLIHMSHRYVAGFVAILMGTVLFKLWMSFQLNPLMKILILTVTATLIIQLLIGATTVWTGFSVDTRTAHLGGATLLWVSTVAIYSVIYVCGNNSDHSNQTGIN
ncbi:MAG: COX15/CtaA family protein [Chloroflexota bacterium]|nr:COX15/CtaA family protein [Chloroflexota bacterium]